MKISQRQAGDVTILEPKGKMTIGAGDVMLRDAIAAATRSGKSKLLLDLHGVSKMDSSGLGELVAAHNVVTSEGGTIRLMNLPSKLYNVMGITQIVSVFDVFDDEQEAISSFRLARSFSSRATRSSRSATRCDNPVTGASTGAGSNTAVRACRLATYQVGPTRLLLTRLTREVDGQRLISGRKARKCGLRPPRPRRRGACVRSASGSLRQSAPPAPAGRPSPPWSRVPDPTMRSRLCRHFLIPRPVHRPHHDLAVQAVERPLDIGLESAITGSRLLFWLHAPTSAFTESG